MKNFVEREFPKLLDLLYDAALHPERWSTFLNALPSSFDGATGIIHVLDTAANAKPLSVSFGHDAAFAASFASYYADLNPYPAIGFHRLPIGKAVHSADYLPTETVEDGEFFNDWMKPQKMPSDHLALLLRNDRGLALLGVAPRASNYVGRRQSYARKLQLLAPHLVRAVEMNRVVSAARQAELRSNAVLDSLGSAAFLLGASGRLLVASAQAAALLQDASVVKLDRSKVLHATAAGEDADLSAAIRRCATGPSDLLPRPLRLTSRAIGNAYVAWVVPLQPVRAHAPSRRFELFSSLATQPAVLVMLASAEKGIDIPPDTIQAIFRLSAAEARLVSSLVAGRSLPEYATCAGLSHNTARNQLASAFSKTGTTRQTELVAMVVRALGNGAAPTRQARRA